MTKEKSITGGEVEAWLDELSAFLYRLAQCGNQDGLEAECLGQGMPALRDYLASTGLIRCEWLPVESAPYDEMCLFYTVDGNVVQGFIYDGGPEDFGYTHWMPLPQPPEVKND